MKKVHNQNNIFKALINRYGSYLLIFVLAFAQFANTINHGYVWDDVIVIEKNEKVQRGIKGIPELLTRNRSNELADQYGFRPAVLVSYAVEVGMFGLNPKVNHFFTVFYFALLCSLIYLMLNLLIPHKQMLCFLTTLLFLVHPLHTEVVANIKGRDEIFALLFTISSFICFFKYSHTRSTFLFIAAVVLFLFGLLSKESNLIFAIIIPVGLVWLSSITRNQSLLIAFILAAISAVIVTGTLSFKLMLTPIVLTIVSALYLVYGLITRFSPKNAFLTAVSMAAGFLVFGVSVAVYSYYNIPAITAEKIAAAPLQLLPDDVDGLYLEHKLLGNPLLGLQADSYSQLFANSFFILFKYLQNFLYPFSLVYYYGFNYLPLVYWNNVQVVLSVFVYAMLIGMAIYCCAHYKELSFAILFYLLSIAPYTHLLKKLDDFMADRYLFTPSVGLCLAFILLLWRYGKLATVFEGKASGVFKQFQILPAKAVVTTAFLLFTIPLLALQTYNRNQVWKDNYTLVSNDLPKLANCSRANYYYANECFNQYLLTNNNQQKEVFKKASIEHFQKSISIHKAAFFAYIGLAKAYMAFNEPQNALPVLQEVLRLYPHLTLSHFQMGHYYYTMQEYQTAIPYLEKAYQIRPKHRETYSDLAWSYYYTGRPEEAVNLLKNGIGLLPDFLSNYGNLSALYFDMGQYDEAMYLLLNALKIDPMGEPVYDMIIYQYDKRGEYDKAEKYYNEAVSKGLLKQKNKAN